jgi:hypothetical protein
MQTKAKTAAAPEPNGKVLRPPAEVQYADELNALVQAEKDPRPLQLPKSKKLAVIDVDEAAINRYIPLTEDRIVYAAGLHKLVVGLTAKGILERWDLQTREKELTRPVPGARTCTGSSWVRRRTGPYDTSR